MADLTLALEMLVNDEKMHKEMSEAAHKRVEAHYRWPKVIKELEDVYRSLYEDSDYQQLISLRIREVGQRLLRSGWQKNMPNKDMRFL